jgi:surfeit locus 1 family protein
VLVLAGCAWLTLWQLDRAEFKRQILSNWHDRTPVRIDGLQAPFDLPQPVRGLGNWDPNRQILVDNQVRNRRQGVFVLTPWIDAGGRIFLVNRGWAAWPSRSAELPDPGLEMVDGAISGVLNRGPAVGARLGETRVPESPDWPLLVTYFDAESLGGIFGAALQPAVVQLDPGHAAHLTGDVWRVVSFGPDRHLGYAMTWATIAGVVAILWLSLSLRAMKRRSGT